MSAMIILMISDAFQLILINIIYLSVRPKNGTKLSLYLYYVLYTCISYLFLKIILINFPIVNDLGICELSLLMAT